MECKHCKAQFEPIVSNKIYCSPECRNDYWRTKLYKDYVHKHGRNWKSVKRKCAVCNKSFLPNSWNQINCGRICYTKSLSFDYLAKNPNLKTRGKVYNWLATRVTVLNRDGFRCQYCGRSPEKDNVVLNIDHITPVNKGGTNETKNLITACTECNLGKSDVLLTGWRKEKTA